MLLQKVQIYICVWRNSFFIPIHKEIVLAYENEENTAAIALDASALPEIEHKLFETNNCKPRNRKKYSQLIIQLSYKTMKKYFFSFLLVSGINYSCVKDTKTPGALPSVTNPLVIEDPRLGTISKWYCLGGDTVFADTLILKLESVHLSAQTNKEQFYFSFSMPVWHHNNLSCSADDFVQLQELNFNGPDCKIAVFKKIK